MGFENSAIRELDSRNPGEHPVIEKMHEKALGVLSGEELKLEDFSDFYGEEVVAKDRAHIEDIKNRFENDETKRASEVLEAIIYLHAELSEWLGPDVETIRPSEYDDIVNGVDLIAEIDRDRSPRRLALGVDITFGSKTLGAKIERIKKEIDADELARVKYFESHGFRGELNQLPRLVVGVEKDTVIELAGLWMNKKNRELGEHSARDIILTEIIEQLRAYREYAETNNKIQALRSYTQALATLEPMEKQLKKLGKDRRDSVSRDKVCESIRFHLDQRFKLGL